jgi:hypothetical protein
MNNDKPSDIDFDLWMNLAKDDPESFEAMRQAAIEDLIENAPEPTRTRLRRLQWRIDEERRLARTPLKACMRLSTMMWRSVTGPGGLQDRVGELSEMLGRESPRMRDDVSGQSAEVLAFVRAAD